MDNMFLGSFYAVVVCFTVFVLMIINKDIFVFPSSLGEAAYFVDPQDKKILPCRLVGLVLDEKEGLLYLIRPLDFKDDSSDLAVETIFSTRRAAMRAIKKGKICDE